MQQSIPMKTGRQARFLKLGGCVLWGGVGFVGVGGLVGVWGGGASLSLQQDRMPVRHHEKLRSCLSIPLDLLPRAEDVPTGPRPRDC